MKKWELLCSFLHRTKKGEVDPDEKRRVVKETSGITPNPFECEFLREHVGFRLFFQLDAPDGFKAQIKADDILKQIDGNDYLSKNYKMDAFYVQEWRR